MFLAIGYAAGQKTVWLVAFFAVGLLGLWASLRALRRSRAILDTPASRVASAAQGYVELRGIARPSVNALLSPMTSLPCLWYRYALYSRDNDKWTLEEEGQSDQPFLLDDGTGLCEIDPNGAEILTTHVERRQVGDHKYSESLLLEGDRLYALGNFQTLGGAHRALEPRQDLDRLLSEWKGDREALHGRFDLDGDRELNEQEWCRVIQAAEQEVERQHRELYAQPARHFLGKPGGGRVYLIANLSPDYLGRRYARWSRVHLTILLAALGGLAWAIRLPG